MPNIELHIFDKQTGKRISAAVDIEVLKQMEAFAPSGVYENGFIAIWATESLTDEERRLLQSKHTDYDNYGTTDSQ